MKKFQIVLCFIVLAALCPRVFADVLYLKNGAQREGKLVSEDEDKVVFRIGGEEDGIDVTFFTEEVKRIDKVKASPYVNLPFQQGPGLQLPRPILNITPFITESKDDAQSDQESSGQPQKQLRPNLPDKPKGSISKPIIPRRSKGSSSRARSQIREVLGTSSGFPTNSTAVQDLLGATGSIGQDPAQIQQMMQDPAQMQQMIKGMDKGQVMQSMQSMLGGDVQKRIQRDKEIAAELAPLLNADEKAYYSKVIRMMEQLTQATQLLFASVSMVPTERAGLFKSMGTVSEQMNETIKNASEIKAPYIFRNYHKKFLNMLHSLQEALGELSGEDTQKAQVKLQQMDATQIEMQTELERILAQKKKHQ